MSWKTLAKKVKRIKRGINSIPKDQAVYFMPGMFFVMLGVITCSAPDLFVAFVASFFIFCGVALTFLAWKFVQFHKRVVGILKQINNSRVIVRTVDMQAAPEYDPHLEGKKIVFH